MKRSNSGILLAVVMTFFVTAGVIYLTPLKWVNIIEPSIIDIDSAAFYDQFKENPERFIFLDVRSEDSYNKVHAVGSVNAPLHTLYDLRHQLPKSGKEIVLICSGGRASGVGYSYLQHYGFFNIKRIKGGIEEWMAQGLPTEGQDAPKISASNRKILANAGCPA